MNHCRVLMVVPLLLISGILTAPSASAQSPAAALGLVSDGLTRAPADGPWQEVAPERPETFGTANEIVHVVAAADFDALSSTAMFTAGQRIDPTTGFFMRTSTGGVTWFAGLRLPAGAVVTRLEVAGCDYEPNELTYALYRSRVPPLTGFELVTSAGATGGAAMPGCDRFSVTPSNPPLVIDNANATYWIVVTTNSGIFFDSARVYYQLQVSAAPATASFGDVPTSHPFFQFIEALVASGITAGCGGGNYCPDAPLTRGQMAVFLSKALGLHFAP